jgi:hypothetical protein
MATGQYEFFGFTEAKGSVRLARLLAARGVRERSMRSLFLGRSIYIGGLLNYYIGNLLESRISVDNTKRVLQSRRYVAL